MYSYIKGILTHKGLLRTGGAYLVVETGGVGYQVHTTLSAMSQAEPLNEPVTVYTTLIVREDAMSLVGFFTREERELFEILETASGVGFKTALSLMSQLSVSEIAAAIMSGNHKRLTAAKGIGPKLAQKMAIELKEKLTGWREQHFSDAFAAESHGGHIPESTAWQEAEAVLVSLGYSIDEVHQALNATHHTNPAADKMSSEEVLQLVLKWLATHPVK